jgi:hypothetical protein
VKRCALVTGLAAQQNDETLGVICPATVSPLRSTALEAWKEITLRPRVTFPKYLDDETRLAVFGFPVAFGVLQSLVQAASNSVGASASVLLIWGGAIPIGAVWGIVQLHLVSGAIWLFLRSSSATPFSRVRYVVALASAPGSYALVAWAMSSVAFGQILFVDPALYTPGAISMGVSLQIAALYLLTSGCLVWWLVLLVLGVRAMTSRTLFSSVVVLLLSGLLMVAALGALILAVVLIAS